VATTRTAAAADAVFDFNLSAVKAETNLAPFRFMWKDAAGRDRRYTIQHIDALDTWPVLEKAEGGDVAAMLGMFEVGMSAEDWKAFRAAPMPRFKLQALWKAYQSHCGADLGEEQASADS